MHRQFVAAAAAALLFVTTGCTQYLFARHGNGGADDALVPDGPVDCKTVDQRFAKLPEEVVRDCGWSCDNGDAERIDTAVHALAKQYATCKQYAGLFERISTRYAGPAALAALEADGQAIEAAFVDYMKTHPGSAFVRTEAAADAMEGVSKWLIQQGHLSHCGELVAALDGASADAHGGAVLYLTKARCEGALPLLLAALGSTSRFHRSAACQALGSVGDASVLPRLREVAMTDSFSFGVAGDAEQAAADAASDRAMDGFSDGVDDDTQSDLDDAAWDAQRASEASEKSYYPVREACKRAYGAVARRAGVGPGKAKTRATSGKAPARGKRGRR